MNPFNDPMMKAMRRAQKIQDNLAYQQAQEMLQRYGHLFVDVNRMVHYKQIQSLIPFLAFNARKDFLTQNNLAWRIISSPEWRASFDAHNKQSFRAVITNLSAARAISEVTQFINNNINFGFPPQSFAAEVFSVISQVEEPIDEQSLQNFRTALENLLVLVINKCKELAPNSINYWAVFNFALTIAFFLYPLYEGQKTEQRIIGAVNQTETNILKEIEKLKPARSEDIYYVVERKAKLRSHPQSNSTIIHILSSNQRVRLIQTKHKWIYVEYFDYIEGIPKNGWLLKKYTERLN